MVPWGLAVGQGPSPAARRQGAELGWGPAPAAGTEWLWGQARGPDVRGAGRVGAGVSVTGSDMSNVFDLQLDFWVKFHIIYSVLILSNNLGNGFIFLWELVLA